MSTNCLLPIFLSSSHLHITPFALPVWTEALKAGQYVSASVKLLTIALKLCRVKPSASSKLYASKCLSVTT